jgi:hypothetical protein
MIARTLAIATALALAGCTSMPSVVIVAQPDLVVIGADPWHDEKTLQPQANRICAQGGQTAVFAGKRQAGTVGGFHYTFRCQ